MDKQKYHLIVIACCLLAVFGITACGDDEKETIDNQKPSEKSVVKGIIEKGPFVQGSKVILYELTANLLQTGKSFTSQTTNDFGAFRFEMPNPLESEYVELETSGYFYNEVRGGLSTSQITLNALSNVNDRKAVNVNVNLVTHLECGRVRKLVDSGKSFGEAKRQAEKELLLCFAITDEIGSPEGISITDNNKNASILLAISTVMLYNKSEAEFSEFIAKFSSDFADNGAIDDAYLQEIVTEGKKNARPNRVITQMKDFYANKGISMQFEDFSPYIDFNGDGVIDENDKAENDTINLHEDGVVEEFWQSKEGVINALMNIYSKCVDFTTSQLELEGLRMGGEETVHSITPQNSTVAKAIQVAYNVINNANFLLEHAPSVQQANAEELDTIMAEAKCLRAFVYYNLAMLWGDVVYFTNSVLSMADMSELPAQSQQADVYDSVYADVCEAVGKLPFFYSTEQATKARFTRNAGLMLKAEIELSLGRKDDAKNTLGGVSNNVYFGFALPIVGETVGAEQEYLPVYSASHRALYQKEATGNTDGLENEWVSMTDGRYGCWAALKRLGKAQEVTGCYDYELLMPYPYTELRLNSTLKQNPGY